MQHFRTAGLLLASLFLAGCHGNLTNLHLPDMAMEPVEQESRLAIAVGEFRDQRPNAEHLGVHIHPDGGKDFVTLGKATLGHTVSKAFTQFMNQSGFSVSADEGSADVRIEADIHEFHANITDKTWYSWIEVDTTMTFTIHNVADGSKTRVTIGAGETDPEIVVSHHDVETLVGNVLKAGFMEFLNTARLRGGTLNVTRNMRVDPARAAAPRA